MRASISVFTVKDVLASLHLIAASQTPRLPGHGAVSIFVETSMRFTPTW